MSEATTPTPADAFRLAVDVAGGQSAFGRLINRSQSTVWDWLDQGKRLPGEYVLAVEKATGISRHELRPDLYPIDETPAGRTGAGSLPGTILAGGAPIASCHRRPVSQVGEPAR